MHYYLFQISDGLHMVISYGKRIDFHGFIHSQAEEPDRTKQQRMMFGNPYRQEKNDGGADEGWSEGTGGLLQRGRKRRRRIQQQGDSPSSPSLSSSPSSSNLSSLADSSAETSSPNTEVTSPQRGQQPNVDSVNTGTADSKIVEPGSGTLEGKDNDHRSPVAGTDNTEKPGSMLLRANHKSSVSIPDKLNEYGDKMRAVEKADNENDLELANDLGNRALDQGRRKRHMAPLGMHQEQSRVVAFLLSVIRALRYSRSSNTKQVIVTWYLVLEPSWSYCFFAEILNKVPLFTYHFFLLWFLIGIVSYHSCNRVHCPAGCSSLIVGFTCNEHVVCAVVRASVSTRLSGGQRQFSGAAHSSGVFWILYLFILSTTVVIFSK